MNADTTVYKLDSRLTREQAANVLGISVSMLAHCRREGQIVAEKNPLTRAVRFVYSDVLALKARREQAGERTTGKQYTKSA